MSPLHRHRLGHVIVVLLVVLLAAASHGGPADLPTCQLEPLTCGDLTVRYPFRLYNGTEDAVPAYGGPQSSSYCGYPGLGIVCDDDKPTLLLGGHDYTVSGINYTSLTVSLADADALDDGTSCPMVDHNVTVPKQFHLPTSTVAYLFFFLNCTFPPEADFPPNPKPLRKPPSIKPVTCGSSGEEPATMSFVLPEREIPPKDWWQACRSVYAAPVLKDALPADAKDPGWREDGYAKALRGGFQVGWDRSSGPCDPCEQSGGKCGYNRTAGFLGCFCANGALVVGNAAGCSKISDTTAPLPGSNKKRSVTIAGVVAGVGGALLVAAVMVFLFICKRRQRKVVNSSSKLLKYRYSGSGGTPTRSRGGDMESGSSQDMGNRFSYEELEEATDSFNENRELGDGGFGTVYKGYLGDGRVVAVKRLYNNSYRRVEQFVNEAAILARLRHPNLVMFYGCTSKESRELLLVYEFVQNGTVADHLHGPRAAERALPWPLRLSIAVESAAALTYLHAIEPPIVHRDVKTNNILLDTDFHVKVADFGLSRLFPLDATHVSTAPQGTPGYVDPEYHQCYQLTDKSDVYSFGVVLVELISSKPAVDITRQRNEINLAGMAISKIQKCRLEELVDVELGYESDPAARKMMTMVAELAFRCLQQNGEMRPPIREVLDVLRAIQDDCLGHKDGGGKGKKDFAEPFSPNTVHAPWDSRNTTPNTSQ
ncbi:LEAF RUST 10 DISEASE-RESISTANCE LOCUS RECEPTOR-LIKE PROTEIN KINASE-like 1.2 isoform X1 [Triticum urartu]|nr:LEAF RUST 10 DISEASE-RESISTANCE LOCUS RECEPTOR-LIKE PROTEIN KINASE-like 1.2 isoform X1 [Triticum urartu]